MSELTKVEGTITPGKGSDRYVYIEALEPSLTFEFVGGEACKSFSRLKASSGQRALGGADLFMNSHTKPPM